MVQRGVGADGARARRAAPSPPPRRARSTRSTSARLTRAGEKVGSMRIASRYSCSAVGEVALRQRQVAEIEVGFGPVGVELCAARYSRAPLATPRRSAASRGRRKRPRAGAPRRCARRAADRRAAAAASASRAAGSGAGSSASQRSQRAPARRGRRNALAAPRGRAGVRLATRAARARSRARSPGCVESRATFASRASAPGAPRHRRGAGFARPSAAGACVPYQPAIARAAQAASRSRWQAVQASGAPIEAVEIGARHAQAVVVPRVDHHVGRARHVAATQRAPAESAG